MDPIGTCELCGRQVDASQGRESDFGLVFCYGCVTLDDEARARASVLVAQALEQGATFAHGPRCVCPPCGAQREAQRKRGDA